MLAVLNYMIKQVRKDERSREKVDFAFEWPRWSSGWQLEAIDELKKVLCYTGNFDGCMYGLQDPLGLALRKPWRVITTNRRLADALTVRCDGGHRHGVTCGTTAKSSAYYTPYLVQIIGKAVCGQAAAGVARLPSNRGLGREVQNSN